MTNNSVSVIIPTFNRAKTLARALSSVIAQTHLVDEIIVINDGSTDLTNCVLNKYRNKVTIINQDQKGVSNARNTGILKARSDWIAFLDSDDEWLPNKIEEQLKTLKKNKHIKICHTDELWIRNGRRVNPRNKHTKYGGWIYDKCLPLCVISPSSVLIYKNLLITEGLFDEKLPACEDYDLWLRLTNKYEVLFLESKLIIKYGGHDDQLSKIIKGLDRFRIQVLEKMLNEPMDFLKKQATLYALAEKAQIFSRGCLSHNNTNDAIKYLKISNEAITELINGCK